MRLRTVVWGIAVLTLSACGGGGDSTADTGGSSGSPSITAQTVSGVAAAGAAMQGATVTLVDATGKSVNCPTDATTGAFQCTVTGLTAPFALSAFGNVADSQATLISVSATGGTQTINITPITNAIAATLVGDDPTKLLGNAGLLQTKVTEQSVKSTVAAYSAALADLLTATGNAGVDLISGPLTAGAPGLDRLLDQVKVNVLPDGGVQISSVGGASSDTPVQLQLAHGVAPSASDAASLPAAATIGGVVMSNLPTASDLSALQTAFNQCFAGSTAASRMGGSVAACSQIVIDDVAVGSRNADVPAAYLDNGLSVDQDLGKGGIVGDDAMNNASFSLPEVIRVLAPDPVSAPPKMWVKISWTRADGIRDGVNQHVQLVVKPSALTTGDTGWRLIGNQRAVLAKVNANAQKWDWLNTAKPMTGTNAFIDSMNIKVGAVDNVGTLVDFAIVKGPGLRNGVFLQPSSGTCDTLNIRAQINGETPAQLVAKYGKKPQCRNNFRLAGVPQDPASQSFTWPVDTAWANPQLSATELASITPMSAYTVDIYENGNTAAPAYSYTVRLRTPSPAPEALRQYAWQDIAQSSRDILTPGTATTFTGGASFPMSWTSKSGLPFVKRSDVQIRATAQGQPQVFVDGYAPAKPAQPGSAITINVPGSQGVAFPSVAGWTGIGDFSFANLSWSDTFDMQFTAAVEYDR